MNNKKMRKLLIFGILVTSIAAVIVMTSMGSMPPGKERVELDPIVEGIVFEEMTANFEVRSQGTLRPGTETILFARLSDFRARLQRPFEAAEILE